MFSLPTGFPRIEAAISNLASTPPGAIPDIRSIGLRVYEALTRNGASSPQLWRKAPYAFWLGDKTGLVSRPDLIDVYFEQKLPEAKTNPRQAVRWIKPIHHVYVLNYNPDDAFFVRLSKTMEDMVFDLSRSNGQSFYAQAQQELDLYDYKLAPMRIGIKTIAEHKGDLSRLANQYHFGASFEQSKLARAAFEQACDCSTTEALVRLRRPDVISALIKLACPVAANRPRYDDAEAKILLANALLLPWRAEKPDQNIKDQIVSLLISASFLKDPREHPALWRQAHSDALRIIMSWMTGRTLDYFFQILSRTADQIWSFRRDFWKKLYDDGYIEEAWVVLGSDAKRYAKTVDKALSFGELSGASSNQSVLLMKIGSFIFAEWSHSGALRVNRDSSGLVPALYKKRYDANELRFVTMQIGNLSDGALGHFSSQQGMWQSMARSFIHKHVGRL